MKAGHSHVTDSAYQLWRRGFRLQLTATVSSFRELLLLFCLLRSSKTICAAALSFVEEQGARVLEKTISACLNYGNEQ